MTKSPITVIIATKNEELNLLRCLKSVQFCDQIIVIDSNSTDNTKNISENLNAEFYTFNYKGGWPKKRQWAMNTLPIHNKWTLLLDADEEISNNLAKELTDIATNENIKISGYWITLRMFFLGKELKHGASGLQKLSFFRTGKGRYEQRLINQDTSMADMEIHEHIIVNGVEARCKHHIIHNNVNSLDRYIQKHNEYSNWESSLLLEMNRGKIVSLDSIKPSLWGNQAQRKRWLKHFFYNIPGFPVGVFLYYYLLRLGFLDGKQGFIYCMFQAIQYFHIKAKMFEKIVNLK